MIRSGPLAMSSTVNLNWATNSPGHREGGKSHQAVQQGMCAVYIYTHT